MLQNILSALVSLGVFLHFGLASQNEASAITTYTEKITCPLVAQLLSANLERKLGRFQEAFKRIDGLPTTMSRPSVSGCEILGFGNKSSCWFKI
jgi:hypothetical protein